MLQQKLEHLEGLVLKPQADAVFAHFTRMKVHVEGAEAQPTGWSSAFHSRIRPCRQCITNSLLLKDCGVANASVLQLLTIEGAER
jgi:hypothetical protein